MFAYTLNQAGQKFVTEVIEKYCKADENGSLVEIGSHYTLTGNPVFISMDAEHFDAQEIEE